MAIKYKKTSLMNSCFVSCTELENKTTEEKTIHVMNTPAPNKEPTVNSIPPDSSLATIPDITSGAPFPKANRVTPAKF